MYKTPFNLKLKNLGITVRIKKGWNKEANYVIYQFNTFFKNIIKINKYIYYDFLFVIYGFIHVY